MRYIFVVIVLLSFLGIYINLTGPDTPVKKSNNLQMIEEKSLNEEPVKIENDTKDKTPEQSVNLGENFVKQKLAPKRFDSMGNKINTTGGSTLTPGKNLVNTRVKNGGVPTTRLADFAGASALRVIDNDFGSPERIVTLKNAGLPWTVYANYELGSLIPVSAKDVENNQPPLRGGKSLAELGQVSMSGPDVVREGTFRQPTLFQNKLSSQKKLINRQDDELPIYIGNVDRQKINERNSKSISRVIPDEWSYSNRPDFNVPNFEKDKDISLDRSQLRQDYMDLIRGIGNNSHIKKMQEKM